MMSSAAHAEGDRVSLSKDAKSLNLVEFWAERADIELLKPRSRMKPFKWSWSDIEPRLRKAAEIVPIEEAERRALVFANPGLEPKPYITQTLFAAYSLYNPGETAPVHRHTPSASRLILIGGGGYTTVGGEKIITSRGDLILTPNGQWHDHGNEGDEPVIWLDVLNVPLVEALDATIFEFDYASPDSNLPPHRQVITERAGHSTRLYSTGGLKPLFVDHNRGVTEHSPQYVYRWADTRRALEGLRDYAGDPHDGIILEYTNPVTGQSVMPGMSYRCQLLPVGRTYRAQRRMASTMYCVLEGHGFTEIDGQKFEWGPNDVFCVPNWAWSRHVPGSEDVVLYSVTDEPVMRKMDLYRQEGEAVSH
jgi:gentisate 1,2-dioxygenase